MTLPNFLVIGAGRSGTTSLHYYLGEHPDVFLPDVKSPSYFFCNGRSPDEDPYIRSVAQDYSVYDAADYEGLFDGVRNEKAIGEVSPAYLATVHAAPRIAARLPDVRLVALLRHPVDRAFARFVGRRRDGLERRVDFADVVRDERKQPLIRDEAVGTYLAAGFVGHFLASYLERFSRDRIRIHLFEDFQENPAGIMRDLFAFLGVDPAFVPDVSRRHNRSGGLVRNQLVRRAWTHSATLRARLRRYLPKTMRDRAFALITQDILPVRLDSTLRAELTRLYRSDIERLEVLLGRDLSDWLDPAGANDRSSRSTASAVV
ncbi:MAG: sulfotransferase family protein [Vicinamibacterales bacterium]